MITVGRSGTAAWWLVAAGAAAVAMAAEPPRPPSPGDPQASFFGLAATGRRFVFVCDRSASMGEPDGQPLADAKRELLASLEGLGASRQFHLIFYNDRVSVFTAQGHRGRPAFADDDTLRSARTFIDRVTADGGTRHADAIAAAARLAPDAIFVLTDADEQDDLTDDDVQRLSRSLGRARVMVAQFGGAVGRRSPRLARLAAATGGEYRVVDGGE